MAKVLYIRDVAKKYSVTEDEFEEFLKSDAKYQAQINKDFIGAWMEENLAMEAIRDYTQKSPEERAQEKARLQREEEEKQIALANMLITSGFNFDGYTIKKYSGYISGDDAVSVDRGMAIFGSAPNVKDKLMESLVEIRRNAIAELKEAAYALGCNAVIGVDFDYLTLDPQTANFGGGTTYQPYIFGVTANGNAVVIEKNE